MHPRPLSPEFFSDRIDGINAETSGKLYEALKKADLLEADGRLKHDPRCASPPRLFLHSCRRSLSPRSCLCATLHIIAKYVVEAVG